MMCQHGLGEGSMVGPQKPSDQGTRRHAHNMAGCYELMVWADLLSCQLYIEEVGCIIGIKFGPCCIECYLGRYSAVLL